MRNITLRCTASELRKELDKIDPVWYNAEAVDEYRNFGGSIYRREGPKYFWCSRCKRWTTRELCNCTKGDMRM